LIQKTKIVSKPFKYGCFKVFNNFSLKHKVSFNIKTVEELDLKIDLFVPQSWSFICEPTTARLQAKKESLNHYA